MATRLDPDQDLLTDLREREPTAAEALITVYGGRAVRTGCGCRAGRPRPGGLPGRHAAPALLHAARRTLDDAVPRSWAHGYCPV
jgi:hypothetical protein